jgi:RNA polymerase sigma-70 factor (ECF subfamily)
MALIETVGDRPNSGIFTAEIAKLIPALRSFARLLYRNEESAADLTQETLAKAWQARSSFAPGTNLKAWLFTIMRNQFRSEGRRAWRQMPWDQESAERIPAPAAEQMWAIELKDTARAIGTLSKRQREALILSGVGGFSSEDAAAIIDCRPTAVKSRVSRARQSIMAMLDGRSPLKKKRSRRDGDAVAALGVHLERLTARAPATAQTPAISAS